VCGPGEGGGGGGPYSSSDLQKHRLADGKHFNSTLEHLKATGISSNVVTEILSIIAAILHLGELEFVPQSAVIKGGSDDSTLNLADATTRSSVNHIVALLGLPSSEIFLSSTTQRTLETEGSTIVKGLTVNQARDVRDALSKELYAKLFFWLVEHLNRASSASAGQGGGISTQQPSSEYRVVSILDIFGFESLSSNGFEQLWYASRIHLSFGNLTLLRHCIV
jgi:myosin heavy subunit